VVRGSKKAVDFNIICYLSFHVIGREVKETGKNPSPAYRQAGPLSRVLPFEKKGRNSVYLLEQENIFYVFIKTICHLMLTCLPARFASRL